MTTFLPIVLGVRRGEAVKGHRVPLPPLASSKTRMAVLRRDKGQCQYCGFVSQKHQTVRPRTPLAKPSKAEDYVTVCLFCDQCFTMESAGLAASGVLVWLPELTQAQLNNICRAAYVARAAKGTWTETAQATIDSLMVRRYEARRRLGTDDPLILASVLSDNLSAEEYAARQKKLEGLKLMPTDRRIFRHRGREVDLFPEMLSHWMSKKGPFAHCPPQTWSRLIQPTGRS